MFYFCSKLRLFLVSYMTHRSVRAKCFIFHVWIIVTTSTKPQKRKAWWWKYKNAHARVLQCTSIRYIFDTLSLNLKVYCCMRPQTKPSSAFDYIHMFIRWLGELLLCDWPRTWQFIFYFSFALHCKLTCTRS